MIIEKTRRSIILVLMTVIFASCWDDFTERSYNSANVLTFSFAAQDTCPDIEDYAFNIDQSKGLIYNLDSLPYGSKVDFICPTLTLQSTNGKLYMGDTIWKDGDSLSFVSPVILKNTSSDGLMTRTYTINVNVHKVDPDSMLVTKISTGFPAISSQNEVLPLTNGEYICFFKSLSSGLEAFVSENSGSVWKKTAVTGINEDMNIQSICVFNSKYYACSLSGNLYVSSDGAQWSNQSSGGNTFVTLYGSINRKYLDVEDEKYLIGIVKNAAGEIYSARSADGTNWTIGNKLDADFPVSGYGATKWQSVTGIQYYTLTSGLRSDNAYCSSLWSTEDGLDWVLIGDCSKNTIPVAGKKGISLFYYDNYLVCLGGINSNGSYNKNIYVSKDHGQNWIDAPDNWILPQLNDGFAYGTIYIQRVEDLVNDKDREFIWCFGGQKETGISTDVWKNYLNKMIFARR